MRSITALMLLFAATAAQGQEKTASTDSPEKAADNGGKMICKRFAETGSLVRSYRTCKTKAEWQRERDNIRTSGGVTNSCRTAGTTGSC